MDENKNFYDYGIENRLKKICQLFGYLKPSGVQRNLIEQVLENKGDNKNISENILISSRAGSGKTFCYLMYLLNKIDLNMNKLQAIILVPTRELAIQTVSYFDKINRESESPKDIENKERDFTLNNNNSDSDKKLNVSYKLLIGGRDLHDINRHETGLKSLLEGNTQVIVGTLGKIYSIFSTLISNKNFKKESNKEDKDRILRNFKCFIIDEGDKLINQNKNGSLEKLLNLFLINSHKNLNQIYPVKYKTSLVLSSASFDKRSMNFYMNFVDDLIIIKAGTKTEKISEENKLNEMNSTLEDSSGFREETPHNKEINYKIQNIIKPLQINSQSEIIENIKEYYHIFKPEVKSTYYEQKYQKLFELLNFLKNDFKQCLIFYNQKGRGEELASDLRDYGWSTTFIHGDLTQDQRILIYEKIKNIQVKIILATDLFSRGIDLSTVDLVINFDLPYNSVEYYHRVGRTGRYNSYGVSLTFLNENEKKILEEIESKTNNKNDSNNGEKFKILELLKLDKDEMGLLKEDLKVVQEKNVFSKDIQNKVKSLDLKIKTEYDKETEYLNRKRRRVQYEKESLISEWVEPHTKLFEISDFKYYEDVGENGENELENKIEKGSEEINNNCEFCLYCNLFKIFDIQS